METFLIKAIQLVVALALLIVIHEFGHYFFARLFGIRVEKFYLFFDPWFSLFKWKPKPPKNRKYNPDGSPKASWRDTEYGIGWLPLGGYCKIAGMIDESMDKEQMAQPAKDDEFRSKPAYQRLCVMVGGVLNNFILAIIIYIGIAWYWGEASIPYENATAGMNFSEEAKLAGYQDGDIILSADDEYVSAAGSLMKLVEANQVKVLRGSDTIVINNPENFALQLDNGFFRKDQPYRVPIYVKQVSPGSVAEKAGLQENDHIIKVGETMVPTLDELSPALMQANGKETLISIVRGSDTIQVNVVPEAGKLGFMLKHPSEIFDVEIVKYNLFQAIPKGISDGTGQLVSYVSSLKYVFTEQGASEIGGFGAIGNLFPAQWNWLTFWELTAFLSIILAFMNILPIPALDGGHVLFVLWEIITRRKPSEKFLEYAQMVGMFILFGLLIYANANDIYRFIFK
ncbi:MAG: RIP metalloprotease RseP [Muribaculaceae bacterium]|nr:RIP metalloprotease RseP [Muribaculaceae bacterium]